MRIYIIDDNLFLVKKIAGYLDSFDFSPFSDIQVIGVNAIEKFFKDIELSNIQDNDIFILDIDLKTYFTGIDIGSKIRMVNKQAYIVYLTAYESKAIEVINKQINPISYITKEACLNQTYNSISKAVHSILYEMVRRNAREDYLNLPKKNDNKLIPMNKFLYAESIKCEKNKILLRLVEDDMIIKCRLKQFKEMNQSPAIYTKFNSYAINIKSIKSWSVSNQIIDFWDSDRTLSLSPYSISKLQHYIASHKGEEIYV